MKSSCQLPATSNIGRVSREVAECGDSGGTLNRGVLRGTAHRGKGNEKKEPDRTKKSPNTV